MFVFLLIGNNYFKSNNFSCFYFTEAEMDYLKNGKRRTIGGEELTFVRCDKDGNIIPEGTLKNLSITNSTIERIVSEVAVRISSGGEDAFSKGIITG